MGIFAKNEEKERLGYGRNIVWGQYVIKIVVYEEDEDPFAHLNFVEERTDKIVGEVNPLVQSAMSGSFKEFSMRFIDALLSVYDEFEVEIIENTTGRFVRYSRRKE